jgi:hypothetical protein
LYIGRVENQIDARFRAIRDAGEPVSIADLDAWLGPVTKENNAAIPLQEAMDKHQPLTSPKAAILFVNFEYVAKPTEPLTSQMKDATVALLQGEQESLLALSEAARLSHCRFPYDHATGDYARLTPLPDLQRILLAKAAYEAELGQANEAFQTLLVGMRVSQACRREPTLLMQIVRMCLHATIVDAIEQSLNRTTFSPEQLRQLQEEIEKLNTGDRIYTGLLFERCHLIEMFENMVKDTGGNSLLSGIDLNWSLLALRNRVNERHILKKVDAMIETARLSPAEALKRAESNSEESPTEVARGIPIIRSRMPDSLAANPELWDQDLPADLKFQASDSSILSCAATGIALLRYRQEKGAFPTSLGDLTPRYLNEVPVDCMDGKALRYFHDDGGFTVYSVGANKNDDKGNLPEEEGVRGGFDDLTFSVRLRAGNGG